jgi:hypothetical protein
LKSLAVALLWLRFSPHLAQNFLLQKSVINYGRALRIDLGKEWCVFSAKTGVKKSILERNDAHFSPKLTFFT